MAIPCRICENTQHNRWHTAREMMYGTREEFAYLECDACGTLQIGEIPDLSKHYRDDYIGFDSRVVMGETFSKRIAARYAGKYFATGKGMIGKKVLEWKPWVADHYPPSMRDFSLGIDFDSRILDFGCGNGRLLQSLHYFGFKRLTGADAYIESDLIYPTGVSVLKRGLEEFDSEFDLIMLHHSFEHLPNPVQTLIQIHRLLKPGKYALIRIPIVNFAWEKYGVNWVQMDPPRHLFLYTEQAFTGLAEDAGFVIEKVTYDSTAFQFWGSEQYARDIALHDPRSHFLPEGGQVFSPTQMDEWQRKADTLNIEKRGDQACFYLRKD